VATLEELAAAVQSIGLKAIDSVEIEEADKQSGEKQVKVECIWPSPPENEDTKHCTLLCRMSENMVSFIVPVGRFEDEPPAPLLMCAWLHANSMAPFGKHEWDPDSGMAMVTGELPLTDNSELETPAICWAIRNVILVCYLGYHNVVRNETAMAVSRGTQSKEDATKRLEWLENRIMELLSEGYGDGI